ncbi:hypothetical protein AAG906_008062 [Vitis piasezkii]
MVEIVISVAAKVAEYLVDQLYVHWVICLTTIATLRISTNKLKISVVQGRNCRYLIFRERNDFNEHERKASKSCFYLKSRYQLSKQAKKQAGDIFLKIQQAQNFGGRVADRLPPPPPPFITSAYEAFPSRESTFNQIMEALRNEDMRMIGVWGMGGAGKTTFVKQVAQQVAQQEKENKLFHEVVMASNITQTPNIAEIQGKIASRLGLKFEAEEDRAGRLKQRYAYSKEFRLPHLSDDEAWNLFKKTAGDSVEKPELRPIAVDVAKKCDGLPVAIVTIANALRGEKVGVWENALEELKTATPISIRGVTEDVYSCLELSYNHLKSDEVKSLFLLCALLGDGDISMDRLLQHAMGLNLFKRIYSWTQATNKLIALVQILKASSLLLEGEDGDDHSSLCFDENENTLVRMHDVVRDVARSIASKDPHHFVVREAVELREWQRADECRNCTRISLIRRNMDELPQGLVYTKQLRILDLSKVSLTPSPSSLGFLSNLQTLRLNQCQIQDITVIGELKKLQVLSLAESNIEQLPNEVAQLSDLRMLDLRDCDSLKVIPRNVISSLSQLEYLSMKGSFRIEWEAEGFNRGERINACLSELKHLSGLRTLEVQVSNPSLFQKMIYSIVLGYDWQIPDDKYKASRRLILQGFTSLCMVKCFSKLLKRSQELYLCKLNDTKHVVYELDKEGFVELKYLTLEECPTVQYILHSSTSVEWVPPPNTFCMLEELILNGLDIFEAVCHGPIPMGSFGNLRILRLEYCEKLKYVFSLPAQHGRESAFPQLQHLKMSVFPELISFYSTRGSGTQESMTFFSQQAAFPALESLRVYRLDNLKALWHNQLPANSFSKLKGLDIRFCDELLNVFPLSVAKVLVQLEDLLIDACKVLEAIVANENEDEATSLFLFPRLTSLSLTVLPQLQRFCFGRFTSRWPLLKKLEVCDCDKVEILFQEIDLKSELDNKIQQSLFLVEKVALPGLESLSVHGLDNIRAFRPDQLPANSFSKLRKLQVRVCNKLLNLFRFRGECSLEAIVANEVEAIVANENEDEAAPLLLFPNLTSLTLRNLHQLKRFCSGRFSSSWPLLKQLVVLDCEKVEILFQQISLECELEPLFWVEQEAFPNLEELTLNLKGTVEIWRGQFSRVSFSKYLVVIPSNMVQILHNLEKLEVRMCDSVNEVIQVEIVGNDGHELTDNEIEFTRLKSLTFYHLPNLKSFCSSTRYVFKFPSLETMEVRVCHEMEFFCKGVLDAPRLKGVQDEFFLRILAR